MGQSVDVRFWGVRGNITPVHPSTEFGNHTTALEVSANGAPSVFVDLGTGAATGASVALRGGIREFDVFMTHLHSDHLSGIFCFAPFYHGDCHITIHSTRPHTEELFRYMFRHPYHPVSFDNLAADVEFVCLPEKGMQTLEKHGMDLHFCPMPHPQGSVGYRFDSGENAFVFATDVELAMSDRLDDLYTLLTEPYPAGLVIVDGFFLPEEIDRYPNWGHSTWQEAKELADRAGVSKLLITHHHPRMTDEDLRRLEQSTGIAWAREGEQWRLEANKARVSIDFTKYKEEHVDEQTW